MANDRRRQKLKGRGKGAPFLAIEHRMADSPEFGALSAHAVKLLFELARQYRPGRNGDISIPWSLLRHRGWHSQGTVAAAKKELIAGNWIVETRKGGKNRSSLFAVTWYPIDASDKHLEPATVTAPHSWRKQFP